ncbi:kynureninase [Halorubrum distributum]|uniref:Kynureninase n=4 Tax=Halorubrum distributum TaxID=29283 RepID=M0DSK4_9EURY|nr:MULTISPECIES: kynureninase [Halorubrum distributum group]ELZ37094.1 kynureninase [Halorubrum terrestre JCM 10247]MDV7349751.1 kynureninase [Halorubrum distributum]MYL67886.1 kynureninase [Halorubrum terrestre]
MDDPYAPARDALAGEGLGSADDADPVVLAARLDDNDPLASFADRYRIPDDLLYMDGNSLGPASDAALASLDRVVDEWRDRLISGWTDADPPWFSVGERLGDALAPLVGAEPEEVVVGNSITVNIHTLVGTFLDELLAGNGPDREGVPAADGEWTPDGDPEADPAVLVNELDFPSDHYAIRAQLRQRGIDPDEKLRVVPSRDGRTIDPRDIEAALAEHDDVGIVFMPTALYRSGQLFDVPRIAKAAHEAGAYAGFDAAHSAGAVPHEFDEAGVDFAVWCTYKYLNAGPGSIGALFVAERHHGLAPALAGWWGHEKATQFEMNMTYTPADSAGAWQIGTPPLLSAAPLEGAAELLREAGIRRVRKKSLALTDFLIALVDERLPAVSVGTPRGHASRGGHVALEHPEAERLSEALRDRGVVVDFRPPNVVRVCPAAPYTSFADVLEVVDEIEAILDSGAHEAYATSEGGVT